VSWRTQAIWLWVGLTAAAVASSIVAGSGAADTVPVIRVAYRLDCTFGITVSGFTIDTSAPPGTPIPPGPYLLQVTSQLPNATFDPDSCDTAQFSITGPGVNWSTTLKYLGVYNDQTNVTLTPSSTYTAVDANHPSQSIRVFATTATGSSSSLLSAGATTSTGKTSASTDQGLVGSDVVPYRGALHASVASSGAAALLTGGRKVGTLTAGQYDIVAKDASTKGGFFVERGSRKPVTITAVAFTGKKTVRITLTKGSWTFFSKAGKPIAFVVA
jgi:hypothetical protein